MSPERFKCSWGSEHGERICDEKHGATGVTPSGSAVFWDGEHSVPRSIQAEAGRALDGNSRGMHATGRPSQALEKRGPFEIGQICTWSDTISGREVLLREAERNVASGLANTFSLIPECGLANTFIFPLWLLTWRPGYPGLLRPGTDSGVRSKLTWDS